MEKIIRKSTYLRVRDKIYDYICENKLYGERLPSESEFAKALGTSRNTVREAIRVLEQEGMVYSRHGVGTFVFNRQKQLSSNISVFHSISSIICSHGYTPGTLSVTINVVAADQKLAAALEVEVGSKVFVIERVRTADGDPVILVYDYFSNLPELEKRYAEAKEESMLNFLKKNYHAEIAYTNCLISATISDDKINEKLHLKQKTALILLSQFHYSPSGQMIFYSDSYFVSDKFNFNVVRTGVQNTAEEE